MNGTRLVRDDEGARRIIEGLGFFIPPLFEVKRLGMTVTAKSMFVGWRVVDPDGRAHGAVVLSASSDGEDYELIADGGWNVNGARKLFRMIFDDMGQSRVSARCRASNARNIKVLKLFGFVEEGRKRLPDGDIVTFGMLKSECRLLKG